MAAPGAWALADPEVSAPNIVLADLDSGEVFFTRAETERIYPASLTKIMTVLLAVEAVERGEISLARYESYLKILDEDEKYRK